MVPGAEKHCHYLKTVEDARSLRTAIGEALESASSRATLANTKRRASFDSNKSSGNSANEDTAALDAERRRRVIFCIVGGGPTGVELAGELSDFLSDICRPPSGKRRRSLLRQK